MPNLISHNINSDPQKNIQMRYYKRKSYEDSVWIFKISIYGLIITCLIAIFATLFVSFMEYIINA
jgi:hypothetical protein